MSIQLEFNAWSVCVRACDDDRACVHGGGPPYDHV